jgi:ceramide glucosyltransferase
VTYLGILGIKVYRSRRFAAAHREDQRADGSVTVLQAILSGDPFLATALRRNLERTPQNVCFVWLIDEDDLEARRITEPLATASKGCARILQCPPVTGNLNPKTVKLQQGLDAVQTDYVAILDDDTILDDDNLGKALFCLATCDLYTGLPCYRAGPNVWSSLVAHFVNNNSIMTYLPLLDLIGPLSINGMFYVMRTQTLRNLGGFTPILTSLCDDYALARLARAAGVAIRQGITPQLLHTTVHGPGPYFALMRRWFVFANVLIRDQRLGVVGLLFLFLGLPPFLLWLGLLSVFGGLAGCLALAAVLLVRHLAVRSLHRAVFRRQPDFSWLLSVVSELLQPCHWAHACLGRTLKWRSRRIRLERDGSFSYIRQQGQ